MKVTAEMKIKDVLKINERMIETFVWLAPEFERLRNPTLRRLMSERVTVSQAARVGHVPLTEALYVLNLAAGEDVTQLHQELEEMSTNAFQYTPDNPPQKPRELLRLEDTDPRVRFVDVMPQAGRNEDPRPPIMHGLTELRSWDEVLLVRHPFDPIPLRDLFARRGFASWAEERRPFEWYIYFYRPVAGTAAVAHPPLTVAAFARAESAGA
jgi:Domain of unknown function (DUF1858)/Uncharacterized conserved protein (DUF2249)